MNSAEIVFNNLICVARADGEVESVESELIERYREALGLDVSQARRIARTRRLRLIRPDDEQILESESLAHLRMLVRVASADGEFHPAERRLIEEVAGSLGVGPLQLADVMVTSSRQVGVRRRLLLAKVLVGVVAIFAVGLAIWAAGEGGVMDFRVLVAKVSRRR